MEKEEEELMRRRRLSCALHSAVRPRPSQPQSAQSTRCFPSRAEPNRAVPSRAARLLPTPPPIKTHPCTTNPPPPSLLCGDGAVTTLRVRENQQRTRGHG
ncbi:unnamed protein product [Pleuronectes platessa]|uniref:Uncharacterized protein n=1 Tax=Pleuronectes platessa TaxID=8262 RepID=A0A9N7U7M5_PLEPL|nr:unnamed protein product [Pleuronectes platessa]